MKKTLTFIINPISGGISKKELPSLINQYLDKKQFDVEIQFTGSAQHNLELAKEAVEKKTEIVVAVGGDGTINNVAKYLVNTGIAFGIIPQGSGNGLARHLNIPMDITKALQVINKLNTQNIDTGMANDVFFLNVAGAGFDAHVSMKFATAAERGFWSYTKITLNEFAKYKSRKYELLVDGKSIVKDAFIICVANGSQYGNNAYIAPQAKIDDGLFEISILKPFKLIQMPMIGLEMFTKKFGNSGYIDTLSCREVMIKREEAEVFNIDGEPVMMAKDILVRINPASLKMIIP